MDEDIRIFEEIVCCRKEEIPAAFVVLVRRSGSAPQIEGAKMLVRPDGSSIGTVGGGRLEAEVIQEARRRIASGRPGLVDYPLVEEKGHVCGGEVQIYFEPIRPAPRLVIVGLGHVGRALVSQAHLSGFSVTAVDDRAEYADPHQLPDADRVLANPPEDPFRKIRVREETCIVVATREHRQDLTVLQTAIRTPARYIGVLGSRRKRAAFFRFLEDAGATAEDLKRIHMPVGLGIGAVTPQEIAVSIAAEIISIRRCHEPSDCGDSAGSGAVQENGPYQTASACPE